MIEPDSGNEEVIGHLHLGLINLDRSRKLAETSAASLVNMHVAKEVHT